MTPQQLQVIGMWIICGTLAAVVFAVVGTFIGPIELVITLLALGGSCVGAAQVAKYRAKTVNFREGNNAN